MRHSHFSMMNYELDSHMKIPVLYNTMMWLSFVAYANLMLISRPTSTMDTQLLYLCGNNNTLSVHFLSAIPNHWWWSPVWTIDINHTSLSSELVRYVFICGNLVYDCPCKYECLPCPSRHLSTHMQFALCGRRIVKRYSLHILSHDSTSS